MLYTPLNLRPAYRIKKPAKLDDGKLNSKLGNINEIKECLMREMLEIDKKRQSFETNSDTMDFAMAQTCKEMIQNRRILLEKLSRSIG